MIFGKHINRYYLRYLPVLLLGIVSLLLVDILQLKIPEFYNLIVNGMNGGVVELDGNKLAFDMTLLIEHVCIPMLFVIVLMTFGRFLWRICFFGSAIRVETDLRRRMFAHAETLSQNFYGKNKVGSLMSLFTNDLETVQECFGMGIMMFGDALLLGTLAIIKMWRMHGLLTLLSLIPMAFMLLIGTLVGKAMMIKWRERQEVFSALSDFTQENFSGFAVVKAFVKEASELLAFRALNAKNERANVTYTKISTLLRVSVTLFVESVICIILGYGSYLVHLGVFNAGELVEFIGYFTAIIWPVMAISELIDLSSRGGASLGRISAFLNEISDVTDGSATQEAPDVLVGEVELRSLSFRYPDGGADALRELSLHIRAGEHVGIVGKTGSGKTTLADLLLRTYNVPDGTVMLDGHDINAIPLRTVRKNIAYVPQDNFLFSDTIARNIAFSLSSDEDGTLDAVKNAAALADVHEHVLAFHDGYDTVLGERGVTVSGGQKQRISIARALVKDAPILILDDAVSAVDTATEQTILQNLRSTREHKTTIMIAHRISTVERMDKIAYLEDGALTAFGTHEELMASCEGYRSLVELQKLEEGGKHNA
ncbi:MAG: ABC transporter ATP-binding protein [Clostridia bacterium]|nr:ABC transporter ATP-binding protein [Clostridia bacterium]